VLAFDAARREVARQQRPWHRALINERAARFYLANGVEHAGFDLLAKARQQYLSWGAIAKVDQLDAAYATVRPEHDAIAEHRGDLPGDLADGRAAVTTGSLDLLGILSASQALSSATSVDRLHARVVEVLGAMTGATGVQLLLCSVDRDDWLLPTPTGATTPVSGTGHEHELPTSVLRYVQRTGEPLLVADATGDDRFARDPYFTDLTCCSLLAVPILSRGSPRAVVLLQPTGGGTAGEPVAARRIHHERLDAVKLVAGQLAVFLENALLYAELTASRARIVAAADHARRRIERDLHDGAQQRLVSLALRLRAAQAAVPPQSGELAAQPDSLVTEANSALDELRELARGIHPAVLAERGLVPATTRCPRR
jgi:GAF domain-containing protein